MTNDRTEIREIDLHAYAEGLLDMDPARRSAVERHLAQNPEAGEFAADVRRQNEEIRALYGGAIAEPIPERHLEVVWGHRRSGVGRLARSAAAAALLIVGGLGGWVLGDRYGGEVFVPSALIESAATYGGVQREEPGLTFATTPDMLFGPASNEVWLRFDVPDLSGFGFHLADRGRLGAPGNELLRLTYEGQDRALNLFVRPRDGMDTGWMRTAEIDGVEVHYWPAGAFTVAMTGDVAEAEIVDLAGEITRSIDAAGFVDQPPAATAASPMKGEPGAAETGIDPGLLPAAAPSSQVN
ncbi:anti-sigma factor family protein [Lutibaculum baratangense]|uniref:Transmembrane regulator protein PrtR n=1 Tax=Lutibaculum baratangense AMV1 TaxID=631454 RepID=V4RAT8_9HYPH|nr:hypothetical protein [Lutibaculum baratangense]ESR22509.1 Transmembrane regulator protein PrtR [Lutibaculum baratangense AMV1]